jgi:hypothetical protein
MASLKGTLPQFNTILLRGVEIQIKKVPFGKLQEFQDNAQKMKDGDSESLNYVKQIILDYTNITVEEDYDPFGNTQGALTLEEIRQLFMFIIADGKKKDNGDQ